MRLAAWNMLPGKEVYGDQIGAVVELVVSEHSTGRRTSKEGADAYPALMFCLQPIGPMARWEGAAPAEVLSYWVGS
jgi:hypothetical protein